MKASIGGGSFELTPAGQHSARIYSLVDIGMQADIYNPPKKKQQIIITWELVDTKMEDGRPFVISQFYSLSLNAKANLRKDIKNMSGKALTDEQAGNFDFTKLINFPCSLVVGHEEKDGKEKASIQALLAAPKGTDIAPLQNQTIFFDTDLVDWALFDAIPEWQRNFIDEDALKAKPSMGGAAPKPEASKPNTESVSVDAVEEDDIPC